MISPPEPFEDVTSIVLVEVFFTTKLLIPISVFDVIPSIVNVDEPVNLFVAFVSLTFITPPPEPEDLFKTEDLVVLKLMFVEFALKSPPMLPVVFALSSEFMRIL